MSISGLAGLRSDFLSFMRERGYQRIKADYLISHAFPTTFNVSGGPNFVDQYLDEDRRDGETDVTIQHCVRHWDYENAGDGVHLSFFEMGVTTALNGFSQHRLFRDHLDFILGHLAFPKGSLHFNVFGGGFVRGALFEKDDEAEQTWLSLGISRERINLIPQGVPEEIAERLRREKGADAVEREAFVANAVEPVGGPRTEIFIDRGPPGNCEPRCLPGFCSCGRFIEFWTSVHYTTRVTPVAHERDRQGEQMLAFEPLPTDVRIYAAAFGLERVMQIVLHSPNICDFPPLSDISAVLVAELGREARRREMPHVWAIADHMRGLTFLILEGAPQLGGKANRSRKYQYRRYLKSLREHFAALELSPERALVRRVVERVLATHREFPPYAEVYTDTADHAEAIASELTGRLLKLSSG